MAFLREPAGISILVLDILRVLYYYVFLLTFFGLFLIYSARSLA